MAKPRVHEIAKEIGITSKELLKKLTDMGEYVSSASSTLEAPVVRKVREAFAPNPVISGAVRTCASRTQALAWSPGSQTRRTSSRSLGTQAGRPTSGWVSAPRRPASWRSEVRLQRGGWLRLALGGSARSASRRLRRAGVLVVPASRFAASWQQPVRGLPGNGRRASWSAAA